MISIGRKNKSTKNYVVYVSDELGSLYVPKKVTDELGDPQEIKITVERNDG